MRRRDPDSLVIGDDQDMDKLRYKDLGKDFALEETLDWLKIKILFYYLSRLRKEIRL